MDKYIKAKDAIITEIDSDGSIDDIKDQILQKHPELKGKIVVAEITESGETI